MNGAKKFHNPDGPAFNPGEVWEGVGGHKVVIKATKRFGWTKWDVDVYYEYLDNPQEIGFKKDAWNFQVRYEHQADKEI